MDDGLRQRLQTTQETLATRSVALSHPDQDHDMALVMRALHQLIENELQKDQEDQD